MEQFRSEIISWETVEQLSRELAAKIKGEGFKPDIIVAIARGGYVPARLLCDYLDVSDLSSIQITHYTAGASEKRKASLVESPNRDLEGKNVLLVDDINDTGKTLELASSYFANYDLALLRIAVLHHKQESPFIPDFYAQKIIKWRWVIYPWAVNEDVSEFVDRLPKRPDDTEEVLRMLEKEYGLKIEKDLMEKILRFQSG